MADTEPGATVHPTVEPEVYEYLEEWADALGCEVDDVAAEAICLGVEDYL